MNGQKLQDLYEAKRLCDLAKKAQSKGNLSKSEILYKEAISKQESASGAEDPSVAGIMTDLALLMCRQRRFDDCQQLLEKALHLLEKAYYADHFSLVPVLKQMVSAYVEQGKYAEAEPIAKRVIDICGKTLSSEHRLALDSAMQMAIIYQHLQKYGDAEAVLTKAMKMVDTPLGPSEEFKWLLGCIFQSQGKNDQAKFAFADALAGFKYRGKYHKLASCLKHYVDFLLSIDLKNEAQEANTKFEAASRMALGTQENRSIFPATLLRA